MMTIRIYFITILSLIVGLSLHAQSDCSSLFDPLLDINVNDTFDPCDCASYSPGGDESTPPTQKVCYSTVVFEQYWSSCPTPLYFRFETFASPNIYVQINDPQNLVYQLDLYLNQNTTGSTYTVTYDAIAQQICVYNTGGNIYLGNLTASDLPNPGSGRCFYSLQAVKIQKPANGGEPIGIKLCSSPVLMPVDGDDGNNGGNGECTVTVPTIGDILSEDTPANLPLLTDAQGNIVYTSDVMDQVSQDSFVNANRAGNIINGFVGSGLWEQALSCSRLNCIDLHAIVDAQVQAIIDNPDLSATFQNYFDQSDTDGPIEDWLSEHLHAAVDNIQNSPGGLAGLVNQSTGFSLPTADCPVEPYIFPGIPASAYPLTSDNAKGQSRMMNGPSMEADADFFSSEIPGIGLDGPGTTAPSPSAQLKTASAGVDLYNGSNNASIPLHTVSSGDVSLPISLSTSSNGLKVDNLGSTVGQNWSLGAGGSISRVVKGLPDEYRGTTRAYGKGRSYRLAPRMSAFSDLNFSVQPVLFNCPGAPGAIPCSVVPGIEGKLEEGAGNSSGPVSLSWRPLDDPMMLNFGVNITIPTPGLPIQLTLSLAGDFGVTTHEIVTEINYEEEGVGMLHLDEGAFNLQAITTPNDLLDENCASVDETLLKKYLQKIHSSRKREDADYFSGLFSTFDRLIEAFQNEFGEGRTVKTKKLDTEPDEFHYSVGGYSGMFQFRYDGSIVLLPEHVGLSVRRLSPNDDDELPGFLITTPDGKRYQFGSKAGDKAVDISATTDLYLPNFYTYGEESATRQDLGEAKIDVGIIRQKPIAGPVQLLEYGQTYENNYKISEGPSYASAWHLTEVTSLLSKEKISLTYNKRDKLHYYANKSFTHTLPNFELSGSKFKAAKEGDLFNPTHTKKTKWQNGRAEFAMRSTETSLQRWDIAHVENQRGERVDFLYDTNRGEISGDKLLSRVVVYRKDVNKYKEFELCYRNAVVEGAELVQFECNPEEELANGIAPQIAASVDETYELGDIYEPTLHDYATYLGTKLKVCFIAVPIRWVGLKPSKFLGGERYVPHRTHLSEYGSVAEVKAMSRSYDFDQTKEQQMYRSEFKRSFLNCVLEVDRGEEVHPLVEIDYKGDLRTFPKRFSIDQDLYGYYNDNTNKSPLPALRYTPFGSSQVVSVNNANQFSALKKHFAFHNSRVSRDVFAKGHTKVPTLDRTEIGSISEIIMASGGKYAFDYEMNEFSPTAGGLLRPGFGLRVARLEEIPGDTPTKTTLYKYEQPTHVSLPRRIYQIAEDQFRKDHELRVTTSSSALNPMFMNGNNAVGYQTVTEEYPGNGSTVTEFVTPENYTDQSIIVDNLPKANHCNTFHHLKRSTIFAGYDVPNNPTQPSVSDDIIFYEYPEEAEPHYQQAFGLVSKQYVLPEDAGGISDYITRTIKTYRVFDVAACPDTTSNGGGGNNSLTGGNPGQSAADVGISYCQRHANASYFRSHMYQLNRQPTFAETFALGQLPNLDPHTWQALDKTQLNNDDLSVQNVNYDNFWCELLRDLLIATASDVFDDAIKRIDKYHYLKVYDIPTRKVLPVYERTDSRLPNLTPGNSPSDPLSSLNSTHAETNIAYGKSEWTHTPTSTFTTFSDGSKIYNRNILIADHSGYYGGAIDLVGTYYFDQSALAQLFNIGNSGTSYFAPLLTETSTNGKLTARSYSSLTTSNGIVVPLMNYALRDGVSAVVGAFADYDTDKAGKPKEYYLAKHGATKTTTPNVGGSEYFAPIYLAWTPQLQLDSRTYLNFTTSNKYNDLFELRETTDQNGVISTFAYDDRGRLALATALNGDQQTVYDYTIGPGNNRIETTTEYPSVPTQVTTQYLDGFGRSIQSIRNNDGALLSKTTYDDQFRTATQFSIEQGNTITYAYEAAPAPRWTTTTDAVANESKSFTGSSPTAFSASLSIDPNGHATYSESNAIGQVLRTTPGIGTTPDYQTTYKYDDLLRLTDIMSPAGTYKYDYNELDKVYRKSVPGAKPTTIWWDTEFRPIATADGKGQVLRTQYDQYNRIVRVGYAGVGQAAINAMGDPQSITDADYWDTQNVGSLLKTTDYVLDKTWIKRTSERELLPNGQLGKYKTADMDGHDNMGRPASSSVVYPNGTYVKSQIGYHAGVPLVDYTYNNFVGLGVDFQYGSQSEYDDVLRLSDQVLLMPNGQKQLVSRLEYNATDRVATKFLGFHQESNSFLQAIQYRYDAAARLKRINTPAAYSCFDEVCAWEGTTVIKTERYLPPTACGMVFGISVEGNAYSLSPQLSVITNSSALGTALTTLLQQNGYPAAQVNITVLPISTSGGTTYNITYSISGVDAGSLSILMDRCTGQVPLKPVDCCELGEPVVNTPAGSSINKALYYQAIDYTGIDISRITLGADCVVGQLQSDYSYDANHRLLGQKTVLLRNTQTPPGIFDTQYKYDPAGNILRTLRNGINPDAGDPGSGLFEFAPIDHMTYKYNPAPFGSGKVLSYIEDNAPATLQPLGFAPASTKYTYDANGNLLTDSGKGIDKPITYNLLNLPGTVQLPDGVVQNTFTFGGEKIHSLGEKGKRDYLGGFEFLDGHLESFQFGDGRVVFEEGSPTESRFQYIIKDHPASFGVGALNVSSAVLFEDKNLDGKVVPNVAPDNPENEVLQRNYYYPATEDWGRGPRLASEVNSTF